MLIATPALAVEPAYIGIWASNPHGCADPSDAFQITSKAMRGKEWMCNIKNISADGVGWLAILACASEGSEYTLASHWQIAPNGRFQETVKTCRPSGRGDAAVCEGQAGRSTEYARCNASTKSPRFRN
jgi:hypothetical protein